MENISVRSVEELLLEVKGVIVELQNSNYVQKGFLTLFEAASYLSISKSALYKLTAKKEITFYSPGGKKIYFCVSDLQNWIYSGKSASLDDVETEVEQTLVKASTRKS